MVEEILFKIGKFEKSYQNIKDNIKEDKSKVHSITKLILLSFSRNFLNMILNVIFKKIFLL